MVGWRVKVLAALAVGLYGCGGASLQDGSDTTPDPASDALAQSFWTEGDFRIQRTVELRFAGSMANVMASIEANGLNGAQAGNTQTTHYDEQNRYVGSETLVFPKSEVSNLPPEGATAMLIEHVYLPGSDRLDYASLEFRDNWSDGGTGEPVTFTTWRDTMVEQGAPTLSESEEVAYVVGSGGEEIRSVTLTSSKQLYNEQGLLVQRLYDRDQNTANGYEDFDTWQRHEDGRLQAIINSDGTELVSYSYDDKGAVATVRTYRAADGAPLTSEIFHYTKVEGAYAMVIESRGNIGLPSEYEETKVALFEEKTCHPTTVGRVRFDRPEWVNCMDAGAW